MITSRQPSTSQREPHSQNEPLLAAVPSKCFMLWSTDTYGPCGDPVLCRAGWGGMGGGDSRWDRPQLWGGGVSTPSAHIDTRCSPARCLADGRGGLGIRFSGCSERGRNPALTLASFMNATRTKLLPASTNDRINLPLSLTSALMPLCVALPPPLYLAA